MARARQARRQEGSCPPLRSLCTDGLHARVPHARVEDAGRGRAAGNLRRGDPQARHVARRRRARRLGKANRREQMPDARALSLGSAPQHARRRDAGAGADDGGRGRRPCARARASRAARDRTRRRAAARRRRLYASRDRPADGPDGELLEVAARPRPRPAARAVERPGDDGNALMRARTEDLLTIRDGEPIDAELRAALTAEPENAREIERLAQVAEQLRRLPTLDPPAGVWERIEAETAPLESRRSARPVWAAVAAVAAVAVAALLVAPWRASDRPDTAATAGSGARPAPLATESAADPSVEYRQLVAESVRLELLLSELEGSPRLMNAGTARTIADLE